MNRKAQPANRNLAATCLQVSLKKPAPSLAEQSSGFVHQFMLECAGVGVERGTLETQPVADPTPERYRGEDFAQDAAGGGGLQPKASGYGQRRRNAGFFVLLADGRLAHADAVYLRHRIQVVGWRERPAPGFVHEKTMIAQVVVVVAGQERKD